ERGRPLLEMAKVRSHAQKKDPALCGLGTYLRSVSFPLDVATMPKPTRNEASDIILQCSRTSIPPESFEFPPSSGEYAWPAQPPSDQYGAYISAAQQADITDRTLAAGAAAGANLVQFVEFSTAREAGKYTSSAVALAGKEFYTPPDRLIRI